MLHTHMKQLSRQYLQGDRDEPKHTGPAVLMRTSMSPEDGRAFCFCGVVDRWWAELSILTCEDPSHLSWEKERVRLLWAGAGLDG